MSNLKIVINLNQEVHSEASTEVLVDDILWISGKTNQPGCNVTLKQRRILKSTDEPIDIRAAIDKAKAEDTEPRRG